MDMKIPIVVGKETVNLHCVRTYKHMGTLTTDCNGMGQEIKTRAMIVYGLARPLRQKVFHNPLVKPEAKLNVLQCLMLSRNTFHVGCYPTLHFAEFQHFKIAIMRLYRMLLQKEESDEYVLKARDY